MVNQALWGEFDSIIRILLSAPLLYLAIVVFIRISGKRTTSQMNNFDWIVTVAIGSLIASGIMSKEAKVMEAIVAVGLLLGLQYLLTWSVIRSEKIADLVKATPRLLVYRGEFLEMALRKERVSKREVLAAVREQGLFALEEVEAVVLETDATFSIIPKKNNKVDAAQTLSGVKGFPPE